MGSDWIKMRTDLYRDPKVSIIADFLSQLENPLGRYINQNMQRDMSVTSNVMRNATVGSLVSVWGVLRHRGKRVNNDLVVKYAALAVVDDIADMPGFGEAMYQVGWVREGAEGLVFPNFFEDFNVDPTEDSKEKNAERQRRYREKLRVKGDALRNVTVTSQSNIEKSREEKSREENIKKEEEPPAPKIEKKKVAERIFLTDSEIADLKKLAAEQGLSPDGELKQEILKASDWLLSKGETKKDSAAFLRNWIRRAGADKRRKTPYQQPPQDNRPRPKPFKPAWEETPEQVRALIKQSLGEK